MIVHNLLSNAFIIEDPPALVGNLHKLIHDKILFYVCSDVIVIGDRCSYANRWSKKPLL